MDGIENCIERVWLYSRYYGDMLFAANEGYAAVTILFNATELVFKSLRGSFKGTFNEDVETLHLNGALTEEEKLFLSDKKVGSQCCFQFRKIAANVCRRRCP